MMIGNKALMTWLIRGLSFQENAKVGKVDDNTAIVVVDVFDPAE